MNLLLLAMMYLSGLVTMGMGLYVAFMPFGDGFAATATLAMGICVMVVAVICTKDQFGSFGQVVTVQTKVHSVTRPAARPSFAFRSSASKPAAQPRPAAPTAKRPERKTPTPKPNQRGAASV